MRLFPIPTNLNPGCWFTNDAEACPRRRRSSKEATRGTSAHPKKLPFPPDGSVCGTEGHRDSLNRAVGGLCHYLLESCSSGRNTLVPEANQANAHANTQSAALYNFGQSESFPKQSHQEAPRIGCTLQPSLRTAAHTACGLLQIHNFRRYQSLPFNLLHSNSLRHKPWAWVAST